MAYVPLDLNDGDYLSGDNVDYIEAGLVQHDADIATKANITQPSKIAITFAGAWVNFGAPYEDGTYWKDTIGDIHLQGRIKSGTGTITTLPVGYRPSGTNAFNVRASSALGVITIASDGVVALAGGDAGVALDLSGISFRPA